MRIFAPLILLAADILSASSPNPPRPVCSKQTAGTFWPEQANSDPELARVLSKRGELEICTRTPWTYRWISPTVTVQQLRKTKPAPEPEFTTEPSLR